MIAPSSHLGPFRLLEPLGTGSGGVIYRALHGETGQPAAVKTLQVARDAMIAGIRREIHVLSGISHPGIIRILAHGLDRGLPWYAMELIEGPSLREFFLTTPPDGPPADPGRGLERRRLEPARLATLLTLLRQICEALAYLHGEGIVHRDLNPNNILIRRDGAPVLLDFGLNARFIGETGRESLALTTGLEGTLPYIAPEQIRGELVDARADLYALGCLSFELLTGRPPFTGTRAADILHQHLEAEPPRASRFVDGLPEALEDLLGQLLAKKPQDRPGHAGDVATRLLRLGARDERTRPLPPARSFLYRSGFVGRQELLASLEPFLTRLVDGTGDMVLIQGESGVGKTRLGLELARRARARKLRVITGDCDPEATRTIEADEAIGAPLHPLRPCLRAIADRCLEGGADATERYFGAGLRLLDRYEPTLKRVPGYAESPMPAELGPVQARARLFSLLAATLEAFSERRPTLLLLDDLQWADPLTLEFLVFLQHTRRLEDAGLLVVGTFRSEEVTPRLRPLLDTVSTRLVLSQLNGEGVAAMVADMLALPGPPPAFCCMLARHSEGNPFFVSEYLRLALAAGMLHRDDAGGWRVEEDGEGSVAEQEYDRLSLPDRLRALVGQRLLRLPAGALALVQAQAVVGREVDLDLLERMVETSDDLRHEALEMLLYRQVLEEMQPGRMRFTHDKIREIAYETLPSVTRADLHRRAASAFESLEPGRRGEHLSNIGRHWEQGGEPSKAWPYYLAGARHAVSRHAYEEAERLFRAYLALAPGPSLERATVAYEFGHMQFYRAQIQGALENLQLGLQEARQVEAKALEASCLLYLGLSFRLEGRRVEALALLQQALEIHRTQTDRRSEGQLLGWIGMVEQELGHSSDALTDCRRALTLHRRVGDRPGEVRTLSTLGLIHMMRGRLTQARACYERCQKDGIQVGENLTASLALSHCGLLDILSGRLERGLELLEQALKLQQGGYHLLQTANILFNLLMSYVEGGYREEAEALEPAFRDMLRRMDNPSMRAELMLGLGEIPLQRGELTGAEPWFHASLAMFEACGRRQGLALCRMGMLREAQGRLEEAYEALTSAVEYEVQQDQRLGEGEALLYLARVERRWTGDLKRASSWLSRGEAAYRGQRYGAGLALYRCERGHLLLARGRSAHHQLARARGYADAHGYRPMSPLQQAITRLEAAQRAFERGEPLVRGETLEPLPEALRRRMQAQSVSAHLERRPAFARNTGLPLE